jgi:hypothetical protein
LVAINARNFLASKDVIVSEFSQLQNSAIFGLTKLVREKPKLPLNQYWKQLHTCDLATFKRVELLTVHSKLNGCLAVIGR